MLIRKTIFALALVGAAMPAAFANISVTSIGGDRDFLYNTSNSTKTRAEVKQELEVFRKNPVTANGGRIVTTDVGYIRPQHSFALQNGAIVHTDTLPHNTSKPSLVMTDAEKRQYREMYSGR